MAIQEEPPPGRPRIRLGPGGGFAYVPGDVVVRQGSAVEELALLAQRADIELGEGEALPGGFLLFRGLPDTLDAVERLRAVGEVAKPNHVLFAHALTANPLIANPLIANPLIANPLIANPLIANPLIANPLIANPLIANPLIANPLIANPLIANTSVPVGGERPPHSTSSPARGREFPQRSMDGPGRPPVVAVLDTGLPEALPDLLANAAVGGDAKDVPDTDLVDWEGVTHPADGVLDPAAGHGAFIAGILEQLAPGCRVHVGRVVGPLGDAEEVDVAKAIHRLATKDLPGGDGRPDILLLSLGAPVLESPFLLRAVIAEARAAGIVVVASAGNAASSVPHHPAAIPGVVSVGAIGPAGPASFTNWGPWVDCCAPGVDLVSSFFPEFDGREEPANAVDVDRYRQWARWSGTSFAAPVVVAALAREMVAGDIGADEAVERVVTAPHLLRIAGLGTVVNI